MPSFFIPEQGANGLDMLVAEQQQRRREAYAEKIRAEKDRDANAKFNIIQGNKLIGDKDVSGQGYSELYNREQSKAMDELIQHENEPFAAYQARANGLAQNLIRLQGKISQYNTKASEGAARAAAIGGDPTLYKNQLANRVFSHDGQNIKSIDEMDIDGAMKDLDNNKHLYLPSPENYLNTYFGSIEKQPGEYKDSDKKMLDGSRQSIQYNYTTKAGISRFNPNTGEIEMVSEPVKDDYGRPIQGRNMIGSEKWQTLQQTPGAYANLEAYLKKINPTIDPETPVGQQYMRELAYHLAEPHKGFITKNITNEVQGNPIDQQIKQQRLENMETQNLLQKVLLANRQKDEDGKPKKLDEFSKKWIAVSKDDKNFITSTPVPITITSSNPYIGNIYDGNFGTSAKTVDAFPISQGFGRYGLGFDEDGKKRYAKEIYRIPNGLIVDDENGNRRVITDPKEFSEFVHSTAPFNNSSPLEAAGIIDNNDNPAPSLTQKIGNGIKKALGIKPKRPPISLGIK